MNASEFHQDMANQHKANALREIERLESQLSRLRVTIQSDRTPGSSNGELGLIGSAVEVQRQVDSWISAATSITVIQHLAKKG